MCEELRTFFFYLMPYLDGRGIDGRGSAASPGLTAGVYSMHHGAAAFDHAPLITLRSSQGAGWRWVAGGEGRSPTAVVGAAGAMVYLRQAWGGRPGWLRPPAYATRKGILSGCILVRAVPRQVSAVQ